jgi:hypothetical protein
MALPVRWSCGVVITKFPGHSVTLRSSRTVFADTPVSGSASTCIVPGKPPRAMWSAATFLGLYRIWVPSLSGTGLLAAASLSGPVLAARMLRTLRAQKLACALRGSIRGQPVSVGNQDWVPFWFGRSGMFEGIIVWAPNELIRKTSAARHRMWTDGELIARQEKQSGVECHCRQIPSLCAMVRQSTFPGQPTEID